MIPLHDLTPTRGTPIVNRLLLLANIAVWIYVLSLLGDRGALAAFYDRYSFDPAELARSLDGSVRAQAFLPLVTHLFVHGGWLHVIGNLLYLWIFGDNVEERLGSFTYLLFYVTCGIAAAIGQALIAPAAMVGASGAVAGVLGAYLLLIPRARVRTLVFLGIFITVVTLPALVVIGLWLVVQVLSGLAELRMEHRATEQVAYFAHLTGFIAGMVLVVFLSARRPARMR